MSDMKMYDILKQLGDLTPKDVPTPAGSTQPIYESVEPRGSIIEAVKSAERRSEVDIPDSLQSDKLNYRGDDSTVKNFIRQARAADPAAKNDLEATIHSLALVTNQAQSQATALSRTQRNLDSAQQMLKKNQDNYNAQEKRFRDLTQKVASGTVTPQDQMVAKHAQQIEKDTDAERKEIEKDAEAHKKELEKANNIAVEPKQTAKPAATAGDQSTVDYSNVPTGKQPNKQSGKPPKQQPANQPVYSPSQIDLGESIDFFNNILLESHYEEGTPQAGMLNWGLIRKAWQSKLPYVDLQFGMRPDTRVTDAQMYAMLATFKANGVNLKGAEPPPGFKEVPSNMPRIDPVITDTLSSKENLEIFFKGRKFKEYLGAWEKVKAKDIKATQGAKPGVVARINQNVPAGTQEDLPLAEQKLGKVTMSNNIYDILGKLNSLQPAQPLETVEETVYESVEPRGDITEAVRQLEEKYTKFVEEGKKLKNKDQFDNSAETGDYYITKKGDKVIKTKTGIRHEKHYAGDEKDDDLDESAKPDFLDLDKDGDTKEPMKKAAKDAKKLEEKAVSKAQQQAAGIALAAKRSGKKPAGDQPSSAMSKMSTKELEKFAGTKHKGLPQHVAEGITGAAIGGTLGALAGGPIGAAAGGYIGHKVQQTYSKEKALKAAQARNNPPSKKVVESESTFDHICKRFPAECKKFKAEDGMVDVAEISQELYDALYDYYLHNGEMPYGTAKARTGDPYQWINDRFAQDLGVVAETMTMETPVVDAVQELDEIARLAGLPTESKKCSSCGCSKCQCTDTETLMGEGDSDDLSKIISANAEDVEKFKRTGELSADLESDLHYHYYDQLSHAAQRDADDEGEIATLFAEDLGIDLSTLEEAGDNELDESTRKHFQAAADIIRALVDAGHKEKALEKAKIHDEIFARENPRYSSEKFFKACGLDECDWNMEPKMTPVEETCKACNESPCKCDEGMMEAEVEEGNEFSGALAKAKAAGEKEFEVDGKKYTVKEDININVSATGEEDVVNLIRKLSGMPVIAIQAPQAEEACDTCGSSPCGCEAVAEDATNLKDAEPRDIEHLNTPREIYEPLSAAIPSGTDANKSKRQDPHTANKAANPLPRESNQAANTLVGKSQVEESLWTAYEEMLKDVKA